MMMIVLIDGIMLDSSQLSMLVILLFLGFIWKPLKGVFCRSLSNMRMLSRSAKSVVLSDIPKSHYRKFLPQVAEAQKEKLWWMQVTDFDHIQVHYFSPCFTSNLQASGTLDNS